jgi:hypothetical protein
VSPLEPRSNVLAPSLAVAPVSRLLLLLLWQLLLRLLWLQRGGLRQRFCVRFLLQIK